MSTTYAVAVSGAVLLERDDDGLWQVHPNQPTGMPGVSSGVWCDGDRNVIMHSSYDNGFRHYIAATDSWVTIFPSIGGSFSSRIYFGGGDTGYILKMHSGAVARQFVGGVWTDTVEGGRPGSGTDYKFSYVNDDLVFALGQPSLGGATQVWRWVSPGPWEDISSKGFANGEIQGGIHAVDANNIYVCGGFHGGSVQHYDGVNTVTTLFTIPGGSASGLRGYHIHAITPDDIVVIGRNGAARMQMIRWRAPGDLSVVDTGVVGNSAMRMSYIADDDILVTDNNSSGSFHQYPGYTPSPQSWIFQTGPTLPRSIQSTYGAEVQVAPNIDNRNPDGSVTITDLSTNIEFDIIDLNADVDLTTVIVTIDSVIAYNGATDTFDSAFDGALSAHSTIANGFHFILDKSTLFDYGSHSVNINVVGDDTLGNSVDESWSFSTLLELPNYIAHSFNVSSIYRTVSNDLASSPVRRLNQFDEHGSMLSLPRLKNEKNYTYKRRIQDAAVHLSNSSYRGLINGITRELGLSLFDAIDVNPKIDMLGNFLASDPYILFDGVWLLLYSDYGNNQLDWAIDRFQMGGNYEHLGRLVDIINTTSFFEASLKNGVDLYTRSMSVLNQSNRESVRLEFISQSTKFRLKHSKLVLGSVFFSNRNTFRNEVANVGLVNSTGDFYIDYIKGIITVFNMPKPQEAVRYNYIKYPFTAKASPVILHDINSEEFRVKMFEQVLQDDGTFSHGLPTKLGTDIINELMTIVPMYWGV